MLSHELSLLGAGDGASTMLLINPLGYAGATAVTNHFDATLTVRFFTKS